MDFPRLSLIDEKREDVVAKPFFSLLNVVLCQHIIVGRDSGIAPTDEPLMVGGNSGECQKVFIPGE